MAEEKVETELGPESKGLLARLGDKLQEGRDATDELGAPLAGITTAVDMSAMTVAAAATTGLTAITSSLSVGWNQLTTENSLTRQTLGGIKNTFSSGLSELTTGNLSTLGAIKGLGSVMSDGLGAVGGKLGDMIGIDLKNLKLRERADKLAKSGGDLLKSGLTSAAKKVGGLAKGILDILLEGAFLLALWGLLKWMEGPGFKWVQLIFDYMVKVVDWIGLLFTDPVQALTDLWDGITDGAASIGNWIWDNTFVPMWTWFKKMFPGAAGVIEKLWLGLAGLAGGLGDWIWKNAIEPVWDWLNLLFDDPVLAFWQLFDGIVNLGEWLWHNAIQPVWEWLGKLFTDPKAALVDLFSGYLSMGAWLWANAVQPLWTWFETTFPDAAAWIKTKWAEFMTTGVGEWLYTKILEPFSKWLDLAFKNPEAALDEAWLMAQGFAKWVFDTVLKPFYDWVLKLFTDPTTALTEAFTFFTSIGDWIYTNALEPFWVWFKALFPDVAKGLEKFWTDLTAVEGETQGGVYGLIMGMLRPAWKWLSGLMDFTSMEGLLSTALNAFFIPLNLFVDMMAKGWDMIKGFFGFTKEEAKLPEDFNIGKFITDMVGKLWGKVRELLGFGDNVEANEARMKVGTDALGEFIQMIADMFTDLLNIDIAALGKSILGDELYAFLFGDQEAEILAKQKAIEMHKKEIAEGDERSGFFGAVKRTDLIRVLEEEIADLNTEMLSKKNAGGLPGKKIPAGQGGASGGNNTVINNISAPQDNSVKGVQNQSQGGNKTKSKVDGAGD